MWDLIDYLKNIRNMSCKSISKETECIYNFEYANRNDWKLGIDLCCLIGISFWSVGVIISTKDEVEDFDWD